ncbi:MAG: hypothetical protein KGL39_29280 [Patescibacteria group bacterium]|nr:hypothetical protein [Patescibacteria group bacterium]
MEDDFANQDADLTNQVLKLGGNPFGANGDFMTPNGLAAQVRRLKGANNAPQQPEFPTLPMFYGHSPPSFQGLLDHAAQAYRHMLNGGMVNLGGLMGWNPAYAYQNFMPWMYGVAQPGQVMGMNQMGGE